MANEVNITVADKFFLGEDKVLSFTVTDRAGVPLDASTWTLEYVVRKNDKTTVEAIPTKTKLNGGILVVGTFNVNPAVNTQKVQIFFPSDDTTKLKPYTVQVYRHSLKRTDVGEEGILVYGSISFLQAPSH